MCCTELLEGKAGYKCNKMNGLVGVTGLKAEEIRIISDTGIELAEPTCISTPETLTFPHISYWHSE